MTGLLIVAFLFLLIVAALIFALAGAYFALIGRDSSSLTNSRKDGDHGDWM